MNGSNVEKYELEQIIGNDELYELDKSDNFQIKYWSYSRSVSELFDMYRQKEIIIPSLQREYVWNYEQASLFIDSILRGLPIPSFFVTEINGKYLMIDGLQRLHTLYLYISGVNYSGWKKSEKQGFILSKKGSIAEHCREKSFSDLSEEYQRKLLRSMMNIIEFSQLSPANNYSSMYQIFERINSTGRALEPQEVRNAAYFSEFNNAINEISLEQKFSELLSTNKTIYRTEYALRSLAFMHIYKNYKRDGQKKYLNLKNTLNEYMAILQAKELGFVIDENKYPHFYDLAEDKINNPYAIDKLKSTIHWIYDNIGLDAFKNIKSVDSDIVKYKNSYQPTLIETLLISVYIISTEMNFKSGINFRLKLNELLQKDSFQDLLGKDTMNSERISTRIDEVVKIFGE